MQWNRIALIIILASALFLRVWRLESVPDGVYSDEASVGYDAFSILKTDSDFHGSSWPLFFKSFGEWKSPVAIYSTVPSIALFGLDPFATRLPSAIFGTLTVLALFLVARELFNEKIGLLAGAFAAVSPWALIYSRTNLESIAVLPALFLFGLWFFLKGLRDSRFWVASAGLFAISLYSYFSSRVFIPLFLISLLWIFRTEIVTMKKQLITPFIIFLLISLPLISVVLFSPQILTARAQVVSILYTQGHSISEFWGNYGQYFSSDFLFNKGDSNLRHSLPGYGQLLWFMAPLILAGIASAIIFFRNKKSGKVLFAWLLLFPVAAALTWEGIPHATRSVAAVGVFEIFAAIGAISLFVYVRERAGRKIAIMISIVFVIFAASNAWKFLNDYFYKYPAQSTAWFESGLGDAFNFIKQKQGSYDTVVLTSSLDQAKTYAAFYLNIPPKIVQSGSYGKIIQCDPSICNLKGKVLILERAGEPQNGTVLHVSKNAAGADAFKIEEMQY